MDPAEVVVDVAVQNEIVQRISEKLRARDVLSDLTKQVCLRLQRFLANGEHNE